MTTITIIAIVVGAIALLGVIGCFFAARYANRHGGSRANTWATLCIIALAVCIAAGVVAGVTAFAKGTPQENGNAITTETESTNTSEDSDKEELPAGTFRVDVDDPTPYLIKWFGKDVDVLEDVLKKYSRESFPDHLQERTEAIEKALATYYGEKAPMVWSDSVWMPFQEVLEFVKTTEYKELSYEEKKEYLDQNVRHPYYRQVILNPVLLDEEMQGLDFLVNNGFPEIVDENAAWYPQFREELQSFMSSEAIQKAVKENGTVGWNNIFDAELSNQYQAMVLRYDYVLNAVRVCVLLDHYFWAEAPLQERTSYINWHLPQCADARTTRTVALTESENQENLLAAIWIIPYKSGNAAITRGINMFDGRLEYFKAQKSDTVPEVKQQFGTLVISKSVVGSNTTQKFSFSIKITDASGKALTGFATTASLANGESTTISNIPAGAKYTVTETAVSGFTADKLSFSGTITANGTARADFVNRKDSEVKQQYGSLTISKTVVGSNTTQKFGFTIAITDANGKALAGFATTASLANGESTTISNIPAGAKYVVTENAVSGFTADQQSFSGTISANTNSKASFVNRKDQEVKPQYGSLVISKSVVGSNTTQKFSFTISITDANGNSLGGFATSASLANGENTTISNIPAGAKYTVTEKSASGFTADQQVISGTIAANKTSRADFVNRKNQEVAQYGSLVITKTVYGSNTTQKFGFSLTITDANGRELSGFPSSFSLSNGESKTVSNIPAGAKYVVTETISVGFTADQASFSGTITANGTARADFVNRKDQEVTQYGSLTISKMLASTDYTGKFSFSITLVGPNGNVLSGFPTSASLGHNESITIDNIPAGTTYTVTEGYCKNFTPDQGTFTGTIKANQTSRADFVNRYTGGPGEEPPKDPGQVPPGNGDSDTTGKGEEQKEQPAETDAITTPPGSKPEESTQGNTVVQPGTTIDANQEDKPGERPQPGTTTDQEQYTVTDTPTENAPTVEVESGGSNSTVNTDEFDFDSEPATKVTGQRSSTTVQAVNTTVGAEAPAESSESSDDKKSDTTTEDADLPKEGSDTLGTGEEQLDPDGDGTGSDGVTRDNSQQPITEELNFD